MAMSWTPKAKKRLILTQTVTGHAYVLDGTPTAALNHIHAFYTVTLTPSLYISASDSNSEPTR